MVRFPPPPPPKSHDTFCPPPLAAFQVSGTLSKITGRHVSMWVPCSHADLWPLPPREAESLLRGAWLLASAHLQITDWCHMPSAMPCAHGCGFLFLFYGRAARLIWRRVWSGAFRKPIACDCRPNLREYWQVFGESSLNTEHAASRRQLCMIIWQSLLYQQNPLIHIHLVGMAWKCLSAEALCWSISEQVLTSFTVSILQTVMQKLFASRVDECASLCTTATVKAAQGRGGSQSWKGENCYVNVQVWRMICRAHSSSSEPQRRANMKSNLRDQEALLKIEASILAIRSPQKIQREEMNNYEIKQRKWVLK